jgi:hypothetical protein
LVCEKLSAIATPQSKAQEKSMPTFRCDENYLKELRWLRASDIFDYLGPGMNATCIAYLLNSAWEAHGCSFQERSILTTAVGNWLGGSLKGHRAPEFLGWSDLFEFDALDRHEGRAPTISIAGCEPHYYTGTIVVRSLMEGAEERAGAAAAEAQAMEFLNAVGELLELFPGLWLSQKDGIGHLTFRHFLQMALGQEDARRREGGIRGHLRAHGPEILDAFLRAYQRGFRDMASRVSRWRQGVWVYTNVD